MMLRVLLHLIFCIRVVQNLLNGLPKFRYLNLMIRRLSWGICLN